MFLDTLSLVNTINTVLRMTEIKTFFHLTSLGINEANDVWLIHVASLLRAALGW